MFLKVWALANNTFKEGIRRRILYVFLIASVAIILSSHFFNFLAPSEELKITLDMGLASILFFGALIAIFSCGELIPREIERQTIATILSKPVKRSEFLLGKFLGGVLLVFLNFLLMSVVFLFLVYFKEKFISLNLIKALILTFWELVVLSSIAICLSTLSSTPAFNVTVTFSIYVVGHLTDYLIHIARQTENLFVSLFILIIYTILPNFNNFNLRDKVVEGFFIPNLEVVKVSLYGLVYAVIMLGLSHFFFKDKEF